ncbi:MAG: hypothetical protein ACYTDW_00395 [Planctomycetota bacterium]
MDTIVMGVSIGLPAVLISIVTFGLGISLAARCGDYQEKRAIRIRGQQNACQAARDRNEIKQT